MIIWECVLVGKLAYPPAELLTHVLGWLKGPDAYGELPGCSSDTTK